MLIIWRHSLAVMMDTRPTQAKGLSLWSVRTLATHRTMSKATTTNPAVQMACSETALSDMEMESMPEPAQNVWTAACQCSRATQSTLTKNVADGQHFTTGFAKHDVSGVVDHVHVRVGQLELAHDIVRPSGHGGDRDQADDTRNQTKNIEDRRD